MSFVGAAAASRVFNEALAKIAMNAQQGGTTDIGKLLIFLHFIMKKCFLGSSFIPLGDFGLRGVFARIFH